MTAGAALLPMPPGQTPRRWQLEAMDAARAGLRTWRRILLSAATGTGKGSLIAGCVVRSAQLGRRVLVLAHRDELIEDVADRIRRVVGAPSVGIVKAERDQWHHPIVVASVQSCTAARRARMGVFDLICVDEAHHAVAPTYGAVFDAALEANAELRVAGFTATPFRAGEDGTTTGLGGVFEAMVFEYPIHEAIAAGDLVPLRAYQVATQVDLSDVPMVGGDFDLAKLTKLVDTPARNTLVVDAFVEHGGGPALVFGATVEHAQHLAEAFVARGIPAAAVWGEMPLDDRRRLIETFKRADGALPVLCSKDLIFEGFDAPATRLVLKARPTQSRVVYQQMIGRGLRLHPGKDLCIFVDLVDNGCALDLSTAADLTDPGKAEGTGTRQLAVGDQVRRWHHDEWGIGVVLEVTPGACTLAKVEWPPSSVHRGGADLTHPAVELRFVPPEQLADEEPVKLKLGLTSQTYEVFLLPGTRRADRIGFYEYSNTWSAGGAVGLERLVVLVKASAKGFDVWERSGTAGLGVTVRRHTSRSREVALSWADSHLRASGATLEPLDADWKTNPVSPAQRRLLGASGIQRDTSQMSAGEASALLDAAITLREVRRIEDPAKFRKAEQIRSHFSKRRQFARRGAA